MKDAPKFRRSLFWDIDPEKIDWERQAKFVISRVMHRGVADEWRQIKEYYGEQKIKQLIPQIRWQDPKTEALFKLWYQ